MGSMGDAMQLSQSYNLEGLYPLKVAVEKIAKLQKYHPEDFRDILNLNLPTAEKC